MQRKGKQLASGAIRRGLDGFVLGTTEGVGLPWELLVEVAALLGSRYKIS